MEFWTADVDKQTPEKKIPKGLSTKTLYFPENNNPIIVTHSSIEKTPLKRSKSQKQVMDNTTANKMYSVFYNEIKKHINHHNFTKKLSHREEWLHIIAFVLAGGTSRNPQVKENLVVGSARANINMRGYESILKNWIKNKEAKELRITGIVKAFNSEMDIDMTNCDRVAQTITLEIEAVTDKDTFKTSIEIDALSDQLENRIFRRGFGTVGTVLLERFNQPTAGNL